MFGDGPKTALEEYFSDLLSENESEVVLPKNQTDADEAKKPEGSEVARHQAQREAKASLPPETGLKPKPPPLPASVGVEPVPPQLQPQKTIQPSRNPRPLEPQPLEMLEREKRDKLQQLLSAQALQAKLEVAPKTQTKTEVSTAIPSPVVETQLKTHTEPRINVKEKPPVAKVDVVEQEQEQEHVSVEASIKTSVNEAYEWGENGRPLWAQSRFDALLFQVSGLTLAVPLMALGQIQPLTDNLATIFGQSEWFMGLLPSPTGQIKTVNTALFVMPEKYNDDFLKSAKYVMTIDGMPWGLAVDSVKQPITLDPGDVNWRSQRTKRPWLAGTVKSAMCALIDIPQMGRLLSESDSKPS